jgi:hypothetical protein
MKILLACEGKSEVYLLNGLIQRGYITFKCPLLLDEPVHLRQLDEISPIINLLLVNEEIVIYRIGDTLKDELSLSKFKLRAKNITIYKYCTKPEIEILVIINEGLYDEYLKTSKNTKPKSFLSEHMPSFNPKEYFLENDMSEPLKEYKRIKKHKKDELYLSDLLIVK